MKKGIVLAMIFMMVALVLCGCNSKSDELRIREIPDMEDWISDPYPGTVLIKCYMIDNPPTDYGELRDLAETHLDANWDDIVSPDDVQTRYKCFFYRASERMPYDWEEDHGYLSEDHIDHHTGDMIIAVRWDTEDPVRQYDIMKKSTEEDTYGRILEEVSYKGSTLITESDETQ